jgi:hypothetical protein
VIFPIDTPAEPCYNGCDSAKIGLAPILAGFAAFVKRKIFPNRIFLGAIKHIMLSKIAQ